MTDYTPPTQEELQRVAAYWQRVKLLSCQHGNGFTFSNSTSGPVCSDCGEVLHFLTDVQLEERVKRQPYGDVRDGLLRQMNRGGATFAIDGKWHEVRFHAHGYDGEDPECVCISTDNVALMLRATEVR